MYSSIAFTWHFPSFSEGLSLRVWDVRFTRRRSFRFPFLFGGTFIEGSPLKPSLTKCSHFPSFSEGLSLRGTYSPMITPKLDTFPFLFGGTFIEGPPGGSITPLRHMHFPSFSEGLSLRANLAPRKARRAPYFPSFSEGLSLRELTPVHPVSPPWISLPFRRDFH